jgi:hypothetical protein
MNLPRFSCSALVALLALSAFSASQAQEATVTTDPVGFQSTVVPVGTSALGNPLVNADTVRAAVASNTASSLTLGGISNVGSLLTAGEPYYVEVVAGALEGERFDVDTAATIAAGDSTVVILTVSANNTSNLSNEALANAQVAVRKHITLEQLQGSFLPALVGNNSSGSADQISLLDPSSGNIVSYFLRGDGVTWRLVGTTTSANKVVIPSGVGFLVTKRGSSTTFTSVGSVRNNDFAFPMPQGATLRAPGFPIAYSPASLGGTAANGWTGNNSSGSADQLQVFDPATGGFNTYFLRGDGVTWRLAGTTIAVTSDQLFADNKSFIVLKRQADPNYVLINPIVN